MDNESNLYIESKIKKLLYEMESIDRTIQKRREVSDYEDMDDDNHEFEIITSEYEDDFQTIAQRVYKLIINYIETKGQLHYMADFKAKLKPLFDDNALLQQYKSNNDYFDENLFLHEAWGFLSAYEAFSGDDLQYLLNRTGLFFLENILANTAVIIHGQNLIVKSESEVYKAVKMVCKAVFPDASEPDTAFVKAAGEYKPDILLPSLNCAIEYKYAETEAKLKATIEGVLADVKHYSHNPNYKIFFAVFYVKPDIWGIQKFKTVWQENEFPDNWKGLYIVG